MQNCSLPQVSVVVSARNASKYIAETLEVALSQRFRSVEIIVIDDGKVGLCRHIRAFDIKHGGDRIHKRAYSLARMARRRASKWRPKCRHRAAQISLAAAPGSTCLALRGRR
jgi:Glycosyl transferase family 2